MRAENGDLGAAEIILRRCWPARRSRPISIDLPSVTDATAARTALARVTKACSAGEITPDEALALSELIGRQLQSFELDELAQRIAALEGRGTGE